MGSTFFCHNYAYKIRMLVTLFQLHTGSLPDVCTELSASGSNRRYYRMKNTVDETTGKMKSYIGVEGTSVEENRAFIAMSDHFYSLGLPVPRVLSRSSDDRFYLQEDMGDVLLFDYIAGGRRTGSFTDSEKKMLCETMRLLPYFQVKGAQNFDFSVCYPQPEFNERSVFWDLNYFKYNFLKTTGIDFQEDKLEDDFMQMAACLLRSSFTTFMYRDFQSRNVMICDGKPYFIDFQGGRKGPIFYDLASFLWQAKANFSGELREELLKVYLESITKLLSSSGKEYAELMSLVTDKVAFDDQLRHFVLFRILQVLGAYGFRGYFEKKTHFLQSIPFAIANLRSLLQQDFPDYPYLIKVLNQMVHSEQFNEVKVPDHLVVTVMSFSYRKGIPQDESGNGGGFVFDCRAVHNPGRYESYAILTGLDEPVIQFLEEDGEIIDFLEHARGMVDASVKRYIDRGFSNLIVCFGCTGGQHRSVYSAQKMAEHIHKSYGVEVKLIHREQKIEQLFKATNNR